MHLRFKRFTFLILGLVVLTTSTAAVYALPANSAYNYPPPVNNSTSNTTTTSTTNSQAATAAANQKTKLCGVRKDVITGIMNRVDTRAANQVALFSTIATRVETFYTNKNKTLSNYSQLVAAVNAVETQAKSDLATLKSDSSFSCSVSDPKSQVTTFQAAMKVETIDLDNLKTAVHNLIVAVATANGVKLAANTSSASQGGSSQ